MDLPGCHLVKNSISNFFGKKVHDDLNPDEVVALGAAVQADILAGNNKDVLLLDVTPLSLGIETMGGLMDVLIPRNSKIPIKAGRQYTTQKDAQSGMRISVYQGERDLVRLTVSWPNSICLVYRVCLPECLKLKLLF